MIKQLIDRLITALTKEETAGACVPNAGNCCLQAHKIVSCTGPCVASAVC